PWARVASLAGLCSEFVRGHRGSGEPSRPGLCSGRIYALDVWISRAPSLLPRSGARRAIRMGPNAFRWPSIFDPMGAKGGPMRFATALSSALLSSWLAACTPEDSPATTSELTPASLEKENDSRDDDDRDEGDCRDIPPAPRYADWPRIHSRIGLDRDQ